jgi:ABC-type antimicrobial peptide transport system permease subunit
MSTLLNDIRYSVRMLLKRPGFTAIVVTTLALGIGVNAALFTAFNIFLRPRPVKEPDSIVRLTFEGARREDRFSFPDYAYLRDHNQSFSEVIAAQEEEHFLLGENRPNIEPEEVHTTVLVRTSSNAAALKDLARREAYALEPVLRLFINTFDEKIARDENVLSVRAASDGATFLGILAVTLASVGIYGVMGWSVVQRTREIGIRMALGAQRHNVVALVLRQGMKLVLLGVVIGVPASLAVAQLLKSMLFGLSATDALTIGVVTALLTIVTLIACYLPARRATRIDPVETLRYD